MSPNPVAQRAERADRAPIAADAFLRGLADHGVDYFFCNPGTDFPPIVEAFARAKQTNAKVPRPMVIPHENLAVAMAHGVYLMTGRPQAVMVHVNVGTANTINNITNMSRERAPVILAAGRTPISEKGAFGARNRSIHWAQEMFDQAGMLRELVKWDYELRTPNQIADVVSRAFEVAMTSPRGPVYLVLPREPLAAPLAEPPGPLKPRPVPPPPHPDPRSIVTLADWVAAAERPLIICASAEAEVMAALGRIAERCAIPVISPGARNLCLPSNHPMFLGGEPGALLAEADLVTVIESDAPWMQSFQHPPVGCRVVNIGEDPNYVRYPMRSFPNDLAIKSDAATALSALDDILAGKLAKSEGRIAARRARIGERSRTRHAQLAKDTSPSGDKISRGYLNRVLGEVVGPDAIVFNEYPLNFDHCAREKPGTFFSLSPAGGLGWGLGAALGAKLVKPDKLVVAAVGDGAYMFTNPTVCHWVSNVFDLPVLTVICNNSLYQAVRGATMSMFKDGAAGEEDCRGLANLDPSPPFEQLAQAQGAHAERVERPDQLSAALTRARDAVVEGGKQAVVNVICP